MAELILETVLNASNDLKNLFELPVMFYALCLYLTVTSSVDAVAVVAGGRVLLGLRTLLSVVNCGPNIVRLRFALCVSSSVVLWAMLTGAVMA